jgi:hypothetical protein
MSETEEDSRIISLLTRVQNAEARLEVVAEKLERKKVIDRVSRDLLQKGVYSYRFVRVPTHYYDLTLQERAVLLSGNVPQLCKSIVFENTVCDHNDVKDITNSRYYCVIIQYLGKYFLCFFYFIDFFPSLSQS